MSKLMKEWMILMCTGLALCACAQVHSSEAAPDETHAIAAAEPAQATPAPADARPPADTAVAERHARLLGLEPGATLVLVDRMADPSGDRHFRYEQEYRGLRVLQQNFVVHEPANGGPVSLSGEPIKGFAAAIPSIEPRLSPADAAAIAKRAVAGDPAGADAGSPELKIFPDEARHPHLAYIIEVGRRSGARSGIVAGGGAGSMLVAIDANTGAVLGQWPTLQS